MDRRCIIYCGSVELNADADRQLKEFIDAGNDGRGWRYVPDFEWICGNRKIKEPKDE